MRRAKRMRALCITACVGVGLAVATHAPAGAQPPPQFESTSLEVDVDAMGDAIESAMNGNAVGFGYAISEDGKLAVSGGGGWARTPADGGVPFTSTQRIDVMSVTKNMTAVAVLRLLDKLNIPIDTAVEPWLPDQWVKGAGFAGNSGVTFRHLLTHKSGLNQLFDAMSAADRERWANDWDGLEFIVSNGAIPGAKREYKNANYALFRVLIPALWRDLDSSVPEVTESDSWLLYLAYMQQELFEPIGITAVSCWPANAAVAPLAYKAQDPQAGGALIQLTGTQLGQCGAYRGLHFSARELVRFQVYLRYTDLLLTPQTRSQMDSLRLGWFGASAGKFWHPGDGYWPKDGKGREIHTCVMKLPARIEASLVVNSKLVDGTNQCTVLRKAFDGAVKPGV